jgi:hypothetical protein
MALGSMSLFAMDAIIPETAGSFVGSSVSVVQYQPCLAVRYIGKPRNFSVRQVIYHHKSFANREVVILSRTASDESRGQQACCHTTLKISNRNRRSSGIHS